jgi:hypothetical protein
MENVVALREIFGVLQCLHVAVSARSSESATYSMSHPKSHISPSEPYILPPNIRL